MQRMMTGSGPMMFPPLLHTVQHCAHVCEHMVPMVAGMPDAQARRNQIRLLADCATICHTLATYLARRSGLVPATAALCAGVCELCANECARFPDQHSQMCAQVCLHCAQECRAYASSMG